MIKRLIISICFLCASIVSFSQEKKAFLVGIGDYAPLTGWTKIHGDNDVSIVKNNLLGYGFEPDNIVSLQNGEATFDAIIRGLNNLLYYARPNDIIYIQFSGHGQQITDLDGDEEDGLDEAWVPYDAPKSYSQYYKGGKHITDDFLFTYLQQLRHKVGKRGKITIVSDACHSGGGSRGFEDDVFIRGTDEIFTIPGDHPQYKPSTVTYDWLFVSACKSYQNNFEFKDSNGEYTGMLTHIISCDKRNFLETSYRDLISGWKLKMKQIAKYPQSIEEYGQPSLMNQFIF